MTQTHRRHRTLLGSKHPTSGPRFLNSYTQSVNWKGQSNFTSNYLTFMILWYSQRESKCFRQWGTGALPYKKGYGWEDWKGIFFFNHWSLRGYIFLTNYHGPSKGIHFWNSFIVIEDINFSNCPSKCMVQQQITQRVCFHEKKWLCTAKWYSSISILSPWLLFVWKVPPSPTLEKK